MDNNLILLVIALLNAFTAYMPYSARNLTKQVEVATNSMKDALVKATDIAAFARGKDEGRVEGEAKAADVAKGVAQQKDKK